MKMKASAGRNPKADLRDRCAHLDLKASCDDEAELLSALYRAMVFGGTITVVPRNGQKRAFEFVDFAMQQMTRQITDQEAAS